MTPLQTSISNGNCQTLASKRLGHLKTGIFLSTIRYGRY